MTTNDCINDVADLVEDMAVLCVVCALNGHLIPFKVKELFGDESLRTLER